MTVAKRLRLFACCVLLACLECACTKAVAPAASDPDLSINLRWSRAYRGENRDKVETGLVWGLSFLGAQLPAEADTLFTWKDNIVTLHLDRAGVTSPVSWKRLIGIMKQSDEYRMTGGIDVGRFLALTLCSPHHYYKLTGVRASFDEVPSQYRFDATPAAIVESAVARGNRLIQVGTGSRAQEIAFVAYEGVGSLRAGSFVKEEIEVIDVMPNGQLRFALYGLDGQLKSAASSTLTSAGKPSKCLWCHETRLQQTINSRTDLPGYHSRAEFDRLVADRMELVNALRSSLDTRIDFYRQQDHTQAELLYLSFYEPSLERLAAEWNVSSAQAEKLLSGLPTQSHHEFAFLGDKLYRRQDVDALAPYKSLVPPTHHRDPSAYEPDLLR